MPADTLLKMLGNSLNRGWHLLHKEAWPFATAPLARLRNPRQIVEAWPSGPIPLGPDVALFAHFDSAGAIRPHVLHHLASLAEAGCSVVLVSNSGRLQPAAMAALREVCAAVLVRRNVGYDFGAWADALLHLGLPRPDTNRVLLVNDSVYGPLAPLGPILQRLDPKQSDAWGLTESWQRRYHLQSYFMSFGRTVLDSPAWQLFWQKVLPLPSKFSIVRHYEIGLTQTLLRAGLRCQALWPYADLLANTRPGEADWLTRPPERRLPADRLRHRQLTRILEAAATRTPLNPTSDLWRQLIDQGYPYLKRELLRDNPTRVADIAEWRSRVAQMFNTNINLIDRDLERTLRHRAP